MRRISMMIVIIMIHSGLNALSASSVDFNTEIEMVMQDQFNTHMETVVRTRVTEAAVDFENTCRKPSPSKNLTFFPLKLRMKPKPKTKVAEAVSPVSRAPSNSRANLIQLYREQVL